MKNVSAGTAVRVPESQCLTRRVDRAALRTAARSNLRSVPGDPPFRSGGQRQISVQARARTNRTVDDDRATEGFDPILQTHQP